MLRKSAPSLLAVLALGAAAVTLAAQTPARGGGGRDSAIAAAIRTRSGDSVGRLAEPEAAGRPADVVTERDNEALVKAIEHKIRCTCGCNLDVFTCRTTDFTCTTSPAMHQMVMARLDAGMTQAQILASFQQQYGEMIFMAPPKHGFNWVAYLMPYVGLAVGLGLLGTVARRLFRAAPKVDAGAAAPGVAPEAASPEELEQLKRELEKFEA
jgi:cytochrome c-type biogenesis protein CcmH/NrfF